MPLPHLFSISVFLSLQKPQPHLLCVSAQNHLEGGVVVWTVAHVDLYTLKQQARKAGCFEIILLSIFKISRLIKPLNVSVSIYSMPQYIMLE